MGDLNYLRLIVFLTEFLEKVNLEKNVFRQQQKHDKLPSIQRFKLDGRIYRSGTTCRNTESTCQNVAQKHILPDNVTWSGTCISCLRNLVLNAYVDTVQSHFNAIFLSIGMDHVIIEPYYKRTISQRNYRKMTISWSFSYNFFLKFHGKNLGAIIYLTTK